MADERKVMQGGPHGKAVAAIEREIKAIGKMKNVSFAARRYALDYLEGAIDMAFNLYAISLAERDEFLARRTKLEIALEKQISEKNKEEAREN